MVWLARLKASPTLHRAVAEPDLAPGVEALAGFWRGTDRLKPKLRWLAGTESTHPTACQDTLQQPDTLWEGERFPLSLFRALCVSVVVLVALFSGGKAALNGYPVGGEHWAYQGLDQVVAYLQENAPPDAVLYHHWLRWHYTYSLYEAEFELRWWQSGEHLQREAMRSPDRAQYIVLPDWRTLEPNAERIRLHPLYETRRQDGSVSLRLYRVEPYQLASEAEREESRAE